MKQTLLWTSFFAMVSLGWTLACSPTSASSPSPIALAETSPSTTSTSMTSETTSNAAGAGLSAMYQRFYGVEVYYQGDTVVINTDDLPDHQSPYFATTHPRYIDPRPGMVKNPGQILTQDITLRIPLHPTISSPSDTNLGPIGVALNGVVFFNQYAGGFQPLDDEILSFDRYGGHPAPPMGIYHYHVEPVWLTEDPTSLIGVVLDGFPVYGPLDANGSSPSDLDTCHGHTGSTPEFPEGRYHYHTASEPPYISGCFRGSPGTALN